MPVISHTDKQSLGGRFTIGLMYLFLLSGSVAMIYPFLIMLSGSTKSAIDSAENRIVPRYLVDDLALYRKFIESHSNESFDLYRAAIGGQARSFAEVPVPEPAPAALADLWREFQADEKLPTYFYSIGAMSAGQSRGVIPENAERFIAFLRRSYGRTENSVNAALDSSILSWSSFDFRPQNFYIRGQLPRADGLARAYREWQSAQPSAERVYFNVNGQYRMFLRAQFGNDVGAYNLVRGTSYPSYDAIPLERFEGQIPSLTAAERQDRRIFVREIANPLWLRISPEAVPAWQAYLAARHGSIEGFNQLAGTNFSDFAAVPLSEFLPPAGQMLIDWNTFFQGWQQPGTGVIFQAPDRAVSLWDVRFQFQDYLEKKFGTLDRLRQETGLEAPSFPAIAAPLAAADYAAFLAEKSSIRWEFTVRNYRSVWGYLAVNGRGILNTIIFCALAVGTALIINPIAAYALSRFRPPLTYKLLLFLMLTMAFPPMVTQIPVFLMLREFNLLNTFAALILPGLANGYSIFLLKGFFDSLPRELYESSEIDGASEWVIFWQITMSLSKPILAVIALGAFTGAYSAFMFAFLVCQDQSMWTIMVWLYQLQQRSGEGVVFASLLIAAVPTLLVFLFAQKIIMRGIAVPVEK